MENRKIYDYLNDFRALDTGNGINLPFSEIKDIADSLSYDILEKMKSRSLSGLIGRDTNLSILKGQIEVHYEYERNMKTFITFDQEKVALGFSIMFNSGNIDMNLGREYQAIINRYFSNITFSKAWGRRTQITSAFEVSLKQLNARDFSDYAAFLLDKAAELGKAIIRNNNFQNRIKHEFSVAS